MLFIYYTIESCFKRYYHRKRSKEFQKGFLECLHLLEIGIEKNEQFNFVLLYTELEEECKKLQKENKERLIEIDRLNNKLFEKSIIAKPPLRYFKEYKVKLSQTEEFSIVSNTHRETFEDMCINFSMRYDWNDVDECKGKMLQFINDKKHLGFKAYKDIKHALKDKVEIK